MKQIAILFTLITIGAAAASAQNSDPSSAIRTFYAFDQKASQTFNRRNLDSRKKWLSSRLYKLFHGELKKQDALLKANPDDKPFFGDGFPFRPTDEPCEVNGRNYKRRYSVQSAKTYKGPRVDIPIRFSYPQPCTIEAVTYKARVVKSGSAWLIDDIIFDDGSTLSESMKNNR